MSLGKYEVTVSTTSGLVKFVIRAADEDAAVARGLRAYRGSKLEDVRCLDDGDVSPSVPGIRIGNRHWPSQRALAEEIGCTDAYVSRLISAGHMATLSRMVVAAEAKRARGAA